MEYIENMTKKEIENLEELDLSVLPIYVDEFYFYANKYKHSSGYRCMTIIIFDEKDNKYKKISTGSDVIHIENNNHVRIDCFYKNKLFQSWIDKEDEVYKIYSCFSDFMIEVVNKKRS